MLDPIQSRGSAIRDNFIFFLAKQIRAKFSATSSHLFSFFPLEIEVRNRHRAPKQQHNHSSQQAQAHHHAVTTQTLSRLTHTHSGKIGRGTFSAQATSQHSATIVLQCIAVISDFNIDQFPFSDLKISDLHSMLCLWKFNLKMNYFRQ